MAFGRKSEDEAADGPYAVDLVRIATAGNVASTCNRRAGDGFRFVHATPTDAGLLLFFSRGS